MKKAKTQKAVIVLGSGMSITHLTRPEIDFINSCEVVIAVNKYMAFYKKTGILPTHVYFHDRHGNNLNMFKHILEVCRNDKLENLTFITNNYFKLIRQRSNWLKLYVFIVDILKYRFKYFVKKMIKGKLDDYQNGILNQKFTSLHYPPSSKIIGIDVSLWTKGGKWAKSLKEPLFHFRGSLTTVLNYVSICYPNREVFLIGNDFNSPGYFFQEELNNLDFEWRDFTTKASESQSLHFSFMNFNGTKISDYFPFILDNLKKTNNTVYCNNKNSLLVTEAGIKYKAIPLN